MASLFVALCRAAEIPARIVWVPEFCYAEFYLLDKNGEGHWLPCSPAGAKAFGEMPDTKLMLAKGDNFRPPYESASISGTSRSTSPPPRRRRKAAAGPACISFTR